MSVNFLNRKNSIAQADLFTQHQLYGVFESGSKHSRGPTPRESFLSTIDLSCHYMLQVFPPRSNSREVFGLSGSPEIDQQSRFTIAV